jgi:hypothetical protein
MRDIQDFAHAPQQSTGRYTNNTAIEPGIIKYLEDESDLRPFFVNKPMQGVLSKSFKMEKDEGIAVQIAGNAEVPRAEDVQKLFTIFLHRNATGYKVDDDEKKINADDPSFVTRKMTRAMERMMKKERRDIAQVFMAAPGGHTDVPTMADFTVSAIRGAVDAMIENNPEVDDVEPDTIFMSYKVFRQLQADKDFKYVPEIFQRLLIDGKLSDGANKTSYNGPTGQYIDGLQVYIVKELDKNVILLDSTKEALWLAEDTQPTITKYRDDEHISDIVDIRHDEQPVCVRPECLHKIVIQA